MGKTKKHSIVKHKQAEIWWDMKHYNDGRMEVGIECTDKSLTFDGHYICIFPQAEGETDSTGAIDRAEAVMAYMRGQKQMKRR